MIEWSNERSVTNLCGYCSNAPSRSCDGSCLKEDHPKHVVNRKRHLEHEIITTTKRLIDLKEERNSTLFTSISVLDKKMTELRKLTDNLPFVESYAHTGSKMYKILNEYTTFAEDKFVLCAVEDGYEKAIEMAIDQIGRAKVVYEKLKQR